MTELFSESPGCISGCLACADWAFGVAAIKLALHRGPPEPELGAVTVPLAGGIFACGEVAIPLEVGVCRVGGSPDLGPGV